MTQKTKDSLFKSSMVSILLLMPTGLILRYFELIGDGLSLLLVSGIPYIIFCWMLWYFWDFANNSDY